MNNSKSNKFLSYTNIKQFQLKFICIKITKIYALPLKHFKIMFYPQTHARNSPSSI